MTMTLKPCPFCGNTKPTFERLGTPRQSCIVACGYCGCRNESADEGDDCGKTWNKRAIEAELSKQEPVAWQERQQLSIGGAWTNWYECPHRPIDSPRQSLLGGVGGIPIEWRPLYTAPLPSAPDTVQVPPSANCWLNGGPCIGGRCDEPRFCAQNDTIAAAPKSTP